MVRGNGSARVETGVKATARPNTIRITMRRGPLRDTLISPRLPSVHFLFVWDAQRNGTHGINSFRFAPAHMIPRRLAVEPILPLEAEGANAGRARLQNEELGSATRVI